jgi:hypothetical protein
MIVADALGSNTDMTWRAPQRECSVIALWLGHESVETTQMYLEATVAMKEKALAKSSPPHGKPGRYKPGDRLLAFLNNL